jgi:hypothetical protein
VSPVAVPPAVHAGRAAPERDRRVDGAGVGRIDLDQGEIVVGAGVGVGLALGLHGQPRVVDEGARLAAADVTGVPIGSDPLVQPSVSVAVPVPEQWAACPR